MPESLGTVTSASARKQKFNHSPLSNDIFKLSKQNGVFYSILIL